MTLHSLFFGYVVFVPCLPLDIVSDGQAAFEAIYNVKVANVGAINSLMHSIPTLAESVVNNMVPGPEDLHRALNKVYESEEQVRSAYKLLKNTPDFSPAKSTLAHSLKIQVGEHVSNLKDLNQTSSSIIDIVNQLNR